MNALDLLESSMRAVGRQERLVVAQAHFELFLSPTHEEQMNFAVPLPPDPPDWTTPVAEMRETFIQHGKRARLEYIAELHPALANHLEEVGFTRQSKVPLMILEMKNLAAPRADDTGARYRRLAVGDEGLLRAFLMNQSIAFGGSSGEEALGWLPNLRSGLASGQVLAAVMEMGGEPVSGGVVQIGEGIGELAGVWTAPQWRNRGLAYTLCQQLLVDYASAGYPLCWLSAAEGAQTLYEKLGFVTVGTQLNYGLHQ
jgi:ribosomal protein S18 acetylase RimI-like enzyme